MLVETRVLLAHAFETCLNEAILVPCLNSVLNAGCCWLAHAKKQWPRNIPFIASYAGALFEAIGELLYRPGKCEKMRIIARVQG
eukprot:6189463-Pleurochrysis_carterae.AAC.4